jgi:hypothetical protein
VISLVAPVDPEIDIVAQFRERPDRLDQRYPALGFFLDELDLVAALAGLEVDAQLTSLPSSS